jgi:hypothetical protein
MHVWKKSAPAPQQEEQVAGSVSSLTALSLIAACGNVGEEGLGELRGVKYLFREGGPQIDKMVVTDGGNSKRFAHLAPGSGRC